MDADILLVTPYMIRFYLLSLSLFCTSLFGQVVIDADSAPVPGDRWSTHVLTASVAQFPLPVDGSTGVTYDFTALGDLTPVGETEPLRDLGADELYPYEILEPSEVSSRQPLTSVSGFQPPETVVSIDFYTTIFFGLSDSLAVPQYYTVRDSGVYLLGAPDVDEDSLYVELDTANARLELPFGLELGDEIERVTTIVTTNDFDGTTDSSTYYVRFEYVSSGSLLTHFRNYDEVAVYRVRDSILTVNRANDGSFVSESSSVTYRYEFHHPGSFLPPIEFGYDPELDDNGELANGGLLVAVQMPERLSALQPRFERFAASVYPNPVNRDVADLSVITPLTGNHLELTLFGSDGRIATRATLQHLDARVPIRFALPRALPSGTYVLRIADATRQATTLVTVK